MVSKIEVWADFNTLEVAQKALKEIEEVVGKNNGEVDFTDIHEEDD